MNDPWASRVRGYSRSASSRVAVLIARQPTWVLKAALAAAMVVLTLVMALLLIPAMVVGAVVLILGGAIARIRLALPRSDGRRNVRVIARR